MAVLLFISVTVNLLSMIYCIYNKRVKESVRQRDSQGEAQQQFYEQVDEKKYPTEAAVTMKANEAYGQISLQPTPNPTHTTGL